MKSLFARFEQSRRDRQREARRLPTITDHILMIHPERQDEDVMHYTTAAGEPRIAILDHSRCR